MNEIDPRALFRLSVLGPLVSRERLERGELQQLIRELAQGEYAIPGTRRRHIGEKTIQGSYLNQRFEVPYELTGIRSSHRSSSAPLTPLCTAASRYAFSYNR